MGLKYFILDVFTDRKFGGNPLAVVRDCDRLDALGMQTIAREFNLSETVFLVSPRDPVNTARARIFTPSRELPFAGHPTVGAAVLIAELDAPQILAREDVLIALEEEVGLVTCEVRKPMGRAARAQFSIPRLPEKYGDADPAVVAAAVGLDAGDIGFDDHRPVVYSAGVGFTFIPVRSREAIARARPVGEFWEKAIAPADHPAAWLYTREVVDEASHVHARMFAPSSGIAEDPATGSAAAAFAGVAMEFEQPEDGDHQLIIEQGFEMGRPSKIALTMSVADGALRSAAIGGSALIVMRGEIDA